MKQVVEITLAQGARILRDDLYPVRVDSVNRTAVLDEAGNIRPGAVKTRGKENNTQIAKVAWLSNRDAPKAYGSIVIYLNRRSDARRFLQEGFFYAGGEWGHTKPFELRERPRQCFNCQEVTDHKAYQCTKPYVCGKRPLLGVHPPVAVELPEQPSSCAIKTGQRSVDSCYNAPC